MIFDQTNIDLSYSFQAFVWLRGLTAKLKWYDDLLKQTWAISNPEYSVWVVSVQFLGNSGPSWVSIAPSSGHLDPLTIPLSFFRESKAVLASTIIFFEDACVFLVYQMHYVLIDDWSTTSLHSVPFDSFIYA